ncbi:hypothetical protein [Sandaracinus amylolyticus]|uniref:hypothetical protein n=1 Tax=Sandaracinus amylolyticus TaxID=927083 RepID=UPI001F2219FC|nr:hypothetical protein [Sandaracinus amylolyticus]UJR84765.1 Hypothetical protein I5071_68440 [Sandaracinus amylolyticus]
MLGRPWIGAMITTTLSLALVSGCDCSGDTGGDPCTSATECETGEVCVEGRCAPRDDGGASDAEITGDAMRPNGTDAGPCRAINAESTVEAIPVDIIIVIDNSGSMDDEAAEVRRNINRFAEIIAASGLDYRVVLISREDGDTGVCVPEPLGSGEPDCASGPEGRLLAIHESVGSHDAPDLVLEHYPDYRDFLRVEAAKVFLWITDDEADEYTADEFRAALADLEPAGMFERTIHDAIVGFYGDAPADWSDEDTGTCDTLANVGTTYLRLAACLTDDDAPIAGCTSGSRGRVCETDWTVIFEDIARGVVAGVPVVCEFEVPDPPEGLTLDLDAIGVTYRSGDAVRAELTRVDGAGACTASGWYFDDPVAPTTMSLCPDVCRTVQADPDARLDVALGCDPRLD